MWSRASQSQYNRIYIDSSSPGLTFELRCHSSTVVTLHNKPYVVRRATLIPSRYGYASSHFDTANPDGPVFMYVDTTVVVDCSAVPPPPPPLPSCTRCIQWFCGRVARQQALLGRERRGYRCMATAAPPRPMRGEAYEPGNARPSYFFAVCFFFRCRCLGVHVRLYLFAQRSGVLTRVAIVVALGACPPAHTCYCVFVVAFKVVIRPVCGAEVARQAQAALGSPLSAR